MKKILLAALAAASVMGMMCSCNTDTTQDSAVPQSSIEISQTSSESSQENVSSEPSAENTDSEKKIDEIFTNGKFTGFAAVVKNGETLYGKNFNKDGISDEFDSKTLFRIGSDTKQFTAAAIMLLQQDGKLSVNDTLEKYFPDCKNGKNITLHNLLSMHSGLTDYSDYFAKLNLTQNADENKAAILKFILAEDLIDEPGGVFTYNNSNYFLLAQIIENVSGMTYEEYLTENIFKPLGMDSTRIYKSYSDTETIAQPLYPQGADNFFNIPYATTGAGDIMSNADDLAKWLKVFEGGSILTDESIEVMSTSYSTENDMYEYGYGWFISKDGIYHGGNLSEFSSFLFTSPDKKYSIIILSNENSGTLADFGTAIRYELF